MKKLGVKMVVGGIIGFALWVIINFAFVNSVISMTESAMWAAIMAWGIAEVPLLVILMGAGVAIPAFIWKTELDYDMTPAIWVDGEAVE